MEIYSYIAITFLFSGFLQGLTGFGAALVAIPLLTLFIDIKEAVPLTILNSVVISIILSLQLKKNMSWRKIYPLIAGSIPGTLIGVTALSKANSDDIRVMLGIMLISYGLYGLTFNLRPKKISKAWSYLAGFASGAIGAAFAAGGPPSIIYTTLTGWSKDDIKATLSGFFLTSSLVIATTHAIGGLTTIQVIYDFTASFLCLVIGVFAGIRCYTNFKTEGYRKVIFVLLILMGIMMVAKL